MKTVKHTANVMHGGALVAKGGISSLKNCTMNRERYKKVLEDHLLRRMAFFLKDGACCLKSKMVMTFLKQSEKEFSIIDWLWNSPDLNPINNCWLYMKRKLNSNSDIFSLTKLVEAIKLISVSDMGISYFQKLVDSMPRRQQIVVDQKGDLTKYYS